MADGVAVPAFSRSSVHGWELIIVDGDLHDSDVDGVRDALGGVLAAGASHVIVDLVGVRAAGPQCLNVLAEADRQLRSAGGELRLVIDGVPLLHAIREAGLSGRFVINRYIGDIVGAVAGIDEGGRGRRRGRARASALDPLSTAPAGS